MPGGQSLDRGARGPRGQGLHPPCCSLWPPARAGHKARHPPLSTPGLQTPLPLNWRGTGPGETSAQKWGRWVPTGVSTPPLKAAPALGMHTSAWEHIYASGTRMGHTCMGTGTLAHVDCVCTRNRKDMHVCACTGTHRDTGTLGIHVQSKVTGMWGPNMSVWTSVSLKTTGSRDGSGVAVSCRGSSPLHHQGVPRGRPPQKTSIA